MTQPEREALRELVDIANLSESIERPNFEPSSVKRWQIIDECNRRWPGAWARARSVLALSPPTPVSGEPTTPLSVAKDIAYPRDFFHALITDNSPYAFYIFQWVPYQGDAQRWRLKMQHDVISFDGREAFNVWPNGSSCGPFEDHEVEFIRISRSQFGEEWKDPRPAHAALDAAPKAPISGSDVNEASNLMSNQGA